MMRIPVVIAGFGHVGQAFFKLAGEKKDICLDRFDLQFEVRAIVTSNGSFVSNEDRDLVEILDMKMKNGADHPSWNPGMTMEDVFEQIERGCLVECTASDAVTGEPARSYIRLALNEGWNVAAAGKRALVLDLPQYRRLSAESGGILKFSGATAAALPAMDILQFSLAGAAILKIEGILNGTSNDILTNIANGVSFSQALTEAQNKGIAEPDPSADVEGWDTASKLLLIANSCLGTSFSLDDIDVEGITGLSEEDVQNRQREGKSVKLIGKIEKKENSHGWSLRVGPEVIGAGHPLYSVSGTEKGMTVLTDTMGSVTVTGGRSNPRGAAAALLKDLINIYRVAQS